MNRFQLLALTFGLAIAPVAAQAQTAAPAADAGVARGAMIFSADGRRIGRVDYVRDGQVGVIFDGRFVVVPIATLSAGERGFTSTLSRAEIVRR